MYTCKMRKSVNRKIIIKDLTTYTCTIVHVYLTCNINVHFVEEATCVSTV